LVSEISVLWPPAGLSETGWRNRVEDLAQRSEALIGKRQIRLQDSASLALEMIGLLWPAIGPETVAASCRASLVMGVPGILASSPFDQAAEIHSRLDDIYAAAQADPAAAVVERPSVMLQRIVPESHAGRPRRVRSQPQVSEPEPPDQALEDHPGDAELITQAVEADQPSELPEPPEREPEDHPVELEPITQAEPEDHPVAPQYLPEWVSEDHPAELPEPLHQAPADHPSEPELSAPPSAPATRVPPDWWSMADAAELLGVHKATVLRWRMVGRLGQQGRDWMRSGRSFAISPALLDRLLSEPAVNGVPEPAGTYPKPSDNGSHQLELGSET
jgi:hypothetical protein